MGTDDAQLLTRSDAIAALADCMMTSSDIREFSKKTVKILSMYSGLDASGLRLKKNYDFDFAAAIGFSPDFLVSEASIFLRDTRHAVEGHDGNKYECLCGMAVAGAISTDIMQRTENGSIWTNDFKAALRKAKAGSLRTYCASEGFETTLMVPVKSNGIVYGMIKLADTKPGLLTGVIVEGVEYLSSLIAFAIEREYMKTASDENAGKLLKAFDLAPCLVAVVAPDLNIREVNKYVTSWLGYEKKEFVGRSLMNYFGDGREPEIKAMLEVLRQGSELKAGEVELVGSNGVKHLAHMAGEKLRAKDGGTDGFVLVFNDLEFFRRIEQRYLKENEILQATLQEAKKKGFTD